MSQVRYNSGIQRAKCFLELASALYDSSLSHPVTRSGTTVPQVNSRLGARLFLQLSAKPGRTAESDDGVALTFSISSGLRKAVLRVVEKEFSILWVNPSVVLTMAYKGLPPFDKPLPVRTIAVFPSWDVLAFAVHESTGITSMEQILERKYPLRVSTRETVMPPFDECPTMFPVTSILGAAGFSLQDIRDWGGSVETVSRPSDSRRGKAMKEGRIDAIFDEGIMSWGHLAIEQGFRILPIEGALAKKAAALGYRISQLTSKQVPNLPQPVQTIDFSGWPMIVHEDMADEVAYALCEAIEARKMAMPTDNYRPLDMTDICTDRPETPRDAPLHPGAERFYRERGYLK